MRGARCRAHNTHATLFESAFYQAAFWNAISIFDVFQAIGPDAARELAEAAGRASDAFPLELTDEKGKFAELDLPHVGRRSGLYCLAVMAAYIVWQIRQANQPYLPDSPLLKAADEAYRSWQLFHDEAKRAAKAAAEESASNQSPAGYP